MLCVAVAVTCCGKSFAIVVYDHRAVDDFIASVPVHVGDTEVVVSFAEPWAARFIVEPPPTLHQFVGFRIHIVGNHLVARVDAACQNIGTHEHRNDASLRHIHTQCLSDLILGEFLTAKIAVHELLARLCNRLHQSLSADAKILL